MRNRETLTTQNQNDLSSTTTDNCIVLKYTKRSTNIVRDLSIITRLSTIHHILRDTINECHLINQTITCNLYSRRMLNLLNQHRLNRFLINHLLSHIVNHIDRHQTSRRSDNLHIILIDHTILRVMEVITCNYSNIIDHLFNYLNICYLIRNPFIEV